MNQLHHYCTVITYLNILSVNLITLLKRYRYKIHTFTSLIFLLEYLKQDKYWSHSFTKTAAYIEFDFRKIPGLQCWYNFQVYRTTL